MMGSYPGVNRGNQAGKKQEERQFGIKDITSEFV
jgi:hypothetical protein